MSDTKAEIDEIVADYSKTGLEKLKAIVAAFGLARLYEDYIADEDVVNAILQVTAQYHLETVERNTVYKSSVTGTFVSKEYADANPDTTFAQTVLIPKSQP